MVARRSSRRDRGGRWRVHPCRLIADKPKPASPRVPGRSSLLAPVCRWVQSAPRGPRPAPRAARAPNAVRPGRSGVLWCPRSRVLQCSGAPCARVPRVLLVLPVSVSRVLRARPAPCLAARPERPTPRVSSAGPRPPHFVPRTPVLPRARAPRFMPCARRAPAPLRAPALHALCSMCPAPLRARRFVPRARTARVLRAPLGPRQARPVARSGVIPRPRSPGLPRTSMQMRPHWPPRNDFQGRGLAAAVGTANHRWQSCRAGAGR